MELLLLGGFAFFAGFVDAVAGGGGLVQVPALLAVYPQGAPATLFGTNKAACVWGTAAAAAQYARRVRLPWNALLPALLAAALCGWLGARVVSWLPPELMRPLVLGLLLAVAVYTFARRDLGRHHAPRLGRGGERLAGALAGAALGFYDGLFGPGTGAFLIFVFVRVFGYDFLHASAAAKLVNFATNLAALAWFVPAGEVLWPVAGVMAVGNVAGALAGSRLALRHGSAFVRRAFLLVVAGLVAKLLWDLLRAGA